MAWTRVWPSDWTTDASWRPLQRYHHIFKLQIRTLISINTATLKIIHCNCIYFKIANKYSICTCLNCNSYVNVNILQLQIQMHCDPQLAMVLGESKVRVKLKLKGWFKYDSLMIQKISGAYHKFHNFFNKYNHY